MKHIKNDEYVIQMDLSKIEYEHGTSYKEVIDSLCSMLNNAFELISKLQDRILNLELQINKQKD